MNDKELEKLHHIRLQVLAIRDGIYRVTQADSAFQDAVKEAKRDINKALEDIEWLDQYGRRK